MTGPRAGIILRVSGGSVAVPAHDDLDRHDTSTLGQFQTFLTRSWLVVSGGGLERWMNALSRPWARFWELPEEISPRVPLEWTASALAGSLNGYVVHDELAHSSRLGRTPGDDYDWLDADGLAWLTEQTNTRHPRLGQLVLPAVPRSVRVRDTHGLESGQEGLLSLVVDVHRDGPPGLVFSVVSVPFRWAGRRAPNRTTAGPRVIDPQGQSKAPGYTDDAPDSAKVTGQTCGTCVHFEAEPGSIDGYCRLWKFIALGTGWCASWKPGPLT